VLQCVLYDRGWWWNLSCLERTQSRHWRTCWLCLPRSQTAM